MELGCTSLVLCRVVLNVGWPPLFSWTVELVDCALLSIVLSGAVITSLVSGKLVDDKLVVEPSVDVSLEVVELCIVVAGIEVVLEKIWRLICRG